MNQLTQDEIQIVLGINGTPNEEFYIPYTGKLCQDIAYKKLVPDAIVPTMAHDTDAAYDLFWNGRLRDPWTKAVFKCLDTRVRIEPGDWNTLMLGVAICLPKGYKASIRERSGAASNYGTQVLAGLIDSWFVGELGVILLNNDSRGIEFKPGDKIAQMEIDRIPPTRLVEVQEFPDFVYEGRGVKGFGSTGDKK